MRKTIVFGTVLFSSLVAAQINFQPGFVITESGRQPALIKNVGWLSNPTQIEYKDSENGPVKIGNVQTVKGFEITNGVEYISSDVLIDRSPADLNNLSSSSKPNFTEETIFLKKIVSGNANLFEYQDGNLKRFFYNTNGSAVEQLIYKGYIVNDGSSASKIGYNNEYRNQLIKSLDCGTTLNENRNVRYNSSSLKKVFEDYNACKNSGSKVEIVNSTQKNWHLNVRPGVQFSKYSLKDKTYPQKDYDFKTKPVLRAGIEVEAVLPFYQRKLTVFAEPTFLKYEDEGIRTIDYQFTGTVQERIKVKYAAVQIPVGLRYYSFLGERSKLFYDAAFTITALNNSSSLEIENWKKFDLQPLPHLALGIGYNYGDRYSAQVRYHSKHETIKAVSNLFGKFSGVSFILGYNILK